MGLELRESQKPYRSYIIKGVKQEVIEGSAELMNDIHEKNHLDCFADNRVQKGNCGGTESSFAGRRWW